MREDRGGEEAAKENKRSQVTWRWRKKGKGGKLMKI